MDFQVLFGSLILTIVFLKWKTSNKKSMCSLVGIVPLIFTVTVATEANYSHKIQSYKGRLIMTKKDVARYTTSRTGGLYDYAPFDAL